MRVFDGVASMRQAGQPWEETGNPVGAFAPDGDFLTYLRGVQDPVYLGTEQRTAPNGDTIIFDRYRFDLNSLALSTHMKEVLARQMVEQGHLPPGVSMEAPQVFAEMTGTGELWIGEDGLPLRQVLSLQFPEQNYERVRATITVNFSDFAPLPTAVTGLQTLDHGIFLLGQTLWQVGHNRQVLRSPWSISYKTIIRTTTLPTPWQLILMMIWE